MTDYEPMATPPPEQGEPRSRGEKPASIENAVRIVWVLVALSVIAFVLTLVNLDDIVDQSLESAGSNTELTESAARAGALVGGVIGLIIGVVLYGLLALFLSKGHNWARIVLTVVAGLGILFGLFGLLAGGAAAQGALALVLSVVTLLLTIALVVLLWRKESSAWLTGKAG